MTRLEIQHISKAYRGGFLANDDINLSIEAGEVFGLLGRIARLGMPLLSVLRLEGGQDNETHT